jgi:hypothetical protein
MKTFVSILIFFLLTTSLRAQRSCGSVEYIARMIQANPSVEASLDFAEHQIQATLKSQKQFVRRDTAINELINIPVVVHVVYNTAAQNISTAQVLSQLTALNNDFSNQNADRINRPTVFSNLAADIRIQFCLARVDPAGKATTGILRRQTNTALFTADDAVKNRLSGGDDAWDCKRYLNIWICNLGARTLGYSSLPGGPANVDGVVINFDVFGTVGNVRSPFNKGRTATHEIGHWLGLKHLWGDIECGDDGIDDTPRQKTYNFNCPSFPHVTECSPSSNGDMFMNYMDFSDDGCMNMFTFDQKKRMRALFAGGNMRNSFLTSFACDSLLAQGGPVAIDTVPAAPVVKADVLKIYPNPVQSFVTIEYKPASAMVSTTFSIYNSIGIKVLAGELTKDKTSLDLSRFTAGVYIIRIGEENGGETAKIFKQ